MRGWLTAIVLRAASVSSRKYSCLCRVRCSHNADRFEVPDGPQNTYTTTPDVGAYIAAGLGYTNAATDDCLQQWSSFWLANTSLAAVAPVVYNATSYTTLTTTQTAAYVTNIDYNVTNTRTMTLTQYRVNGGFTIGTTTSTETYTYTGETDSYITYSTGTQTLLLPSTTTVPTSTASAATALVTPICSLPSIVPACNSQWNEYEEWQFSSPSLPLTPVCNWTAPGCSASWSTLFQAESSFQSEKTAVTSPLCTHASLRSDLCESLRSSAQADPVRKPYIKVTTTLANATSVRYDWPSSSLLAPGCNLGCGQCAITGGTVQLIYWPATATGNLTHLRRDDVAVTATGYGTTFTSPTVYIRYDSLYASDSCSRVGSTYNATIVPLTDSAHLSSIYGMFPAYQTAPFNFTDLNEPVPYSIYTLMPRCTQQTRYCYFGGCPASISRCATGLPYEPILALPMELRQLDPAWASCAGDLRGVYDPPTALQPVAALTTPTVYAPAKTSVPASPASAVAETAASTLSSAVSQASSVVTGPASSIDAPTSASTQSSVASSPYNAVSEVETYTFQTGSASVTVSSSPTEQATTGISTSNPAGLIISLLAGTQTSSSIGAELVPVGSITSTSPSSALSGDAPHTQTEPSQISTSAATVPSQPHDSSQAGNGPPTDTTSVEATASTSAAGTVVGLSSAWLASMSTILPSTSIPVNLFSASNPPSLTPTSIPSTTPSLGQPTLASAAQATLSISDTIVPYQLVTVSGAEAVSIADQTISTGGPVATVAGHEVSVATGALIVGTSVVVYPADLTRSFTFTSTSTPIAPSRLTLPSLVTFGSSADSSSSSDIGPVSSEREGESAAVAKSMRTGSISSSAPSSVGAELTSVITYSAAASATPSASAFRGAAGKKSFEWSLAWSSSCIAVLRLLCP